MHASAVPPPPFHLAEEMATVRNVPRIDSYIMKRFLSYSRAYRPSFAAVPTP